MAIPTFNPPVPPQPQTSTSQDVRLLEAEFGDGYTQVTRDGINHIKHKARLVWTSVHKLHSNEIISFFEERGGDQPFWYRLPDVPERMRWRCIKWDRTYAANDRRQITADLVQDFSLAS